MKTLIFLRPALRKVFIQKRTIFNSSKFLTDRSLLKCAVESGDETKVKDLLQKGYDPVDKTIFGNSPLSRAVESNSTKILIPLLESVKQRNKLTPALLTDLLIKANELEHLDAMRILLLNNAKVPIRTREVKTDETYIPAGGRALVAYDDYSEIFDFGMTTLHAASDVEAAAKAVEKMPYILDNKCTVGMSAVHIAAQNGNLELLKYLTEKANANLTLTNIINETALDTAHRHNQTAAAYLKKVGAPTANELLNKTRLKRYTQS